VFQNRILPGYKKPPPAGEGRRRETWTAYECRGVLDARDVRRVEALCTRLDLELDFLTLGECLEAVHADRGKVHEDVLATFLFNEPVPLCVIEPLHFPSGHASCLLRGEPSPHQIVQGKPTPVCGPYIDAPCKFVKRTLCPATRYRSRPITEAQQTHDAAKTPNVTYITVLRRF